MRRLVIAFVLVASCGGGDRQAPVANQQPPQARPQEPDPAVEHARRERELDEAIKAARDAAERIDKIAADLEDLDRRVATAIDQITAAQTDADRATALARLRELQREKQEMEQRVREAKAAAARAARGKRVKVSQECLDNPLAKGCS